MNPESDAYIHLSMGWAPASEVYRSRVERRRAMARLKARKQELHEAAVARRRKRKRGGPK